MSCRTLLLAARVRRGSNQVGGGVVVRVLGITPSFNATVDICFFAHAVETGSQCDNGIDDDCELAWARV